MPAYDTVIKNGMIIDGNRSPRYRGDIGVKDGLIAMIGHIPEADGRRVIDAEGLIVAPGVVDLHTHYDAQLFWDPYCSISGWHGVTSLVIGNCGLGFAPVSPEQRERTMLAMTRVEAVPFRSMQLGLPWDWITFPQFLDRVDAAPKAVNIMAFVPVNPLLVWGLGLDDAKAGRLPTQAEEDEMCRILDEAMEAGACGWSAQRLPPSGPAAAQRDFDGSAMPSDMMHDETCRAFAQVLGKRNDGFIQLTMVSGKPKIDAKHYEELAEISGRPVLYNAVLARDDKPEQHRHSIRWLNDCQRRGVRVIGQGQTTDAGFSFTFEDWNLFDDSSNWAEATTGTHAEKLAKMADPGRRAGLRDHTRFTATVPVPQIILCEPALEKFREFKDLSLAEVGRRMGVHPVDAMLDIAVEEDLKTGFYGNSPNESIDHWKEIIANPYILLGVSDGGAHTRFLTAGRYPTESIIRIVREHNLLSLEEVHWRLSALPASCAGLSNRGVLRRGAAADIIIYDFERLEMVDWEVLHDLPGDEWRRVQRARGYRWVLVNGEVTMEDDQETGRMSGRLLRKR